VAFIASRGRACRFRVDMAPVVSLGTFPTLVQMSVKAGHVGELVLDGSLLFVILIIVVVVVVVSVILLDDELGRCDVLGPITLAGLL